jgi:hypothetical protein
MNCILMKALFNVGQLVTSPLDPDGYELIFPNCPIELKAKLGICCLFMNELEIAENYIMKLLDGDIAGYPEAFYDIGEAYLTIGQTFYALSFFKTILASGVLYFY